MYTRLFDQVGHGGWRAGSARRSLAHPDRRRFELGKPAGSPGRIALPVAGDDPNTKPTVMELVDALGFDPIDAGTIDESWRQQPGTPVYAADLDAAGVVRALAEASPDRPENLRA